jgi:CubicO group peptidase (beta-lactamase class C family)
MTGWTPDNNGITTAQLLSNSSGLVGLFPNPAFGPYICQFVGAGSVESCGRGIYLTTADDADVVAPDTRFRYGGGQWQVAGAVAEAVSGSTWGQLIDEIYTGPCGLESFGYTNHYALFDSSAGYPAAFDGDVSALPTDNPNIEGGAYGVPGDFAKLLLMLLRDGTCGPNRVLSEAAVERLTTERAEATYGSPSPYAYGWWVTPGEPLTDPSSYGAGVWLDRNGRYAAYLALETDGPTGNPLRRELYRRVDEVMTRPALPAPIPPPGTTPAPPGKK